MSQTLHYVCWTDDASKLGYTEGSLPGSHLVVRDVTRLDELVVRPVQPRTVFL